MITFSGDGGLAMLLGDLLTLRQLSLLVKLVVFNNGALAFVEPEMKAAGFVTYTTGLQDPNIAAVAHAIGLHAQCVERPDELEGAVRAALEHDGPALIEAMVARQELSMPPTITLDQAKGFTLFANAPSCPAAATSSSTLLRRIWPGASFPENPIAGDRWRS